MAKTKKEIIAQIQQHKKKNIQVRLKERTEYFTNLLYYTLFDTGDFYNSFVIFVGKQVFEIEADTIKMENENWWVRNNISKDAILGLTDENKDKLAQKVKEKYINEARILLGIR